MQALRLYIQIVKIMKYNSFEIGICKIENFTIHVHVCSIYLKI